MKGTYKVGIKPEKFVEMKIIFQSSGDANEKIKQPAEIPKMVKSITGFEEAIRIYACRVIHVTFQNIEKDLLSRLLGGANG